MVQVLITGGCGFIGLNLTEYLLENTDWNIRVLDYGENTLTSLEGIDFNRVSYVKGDIRDKNDVLEAVKGCDFVVNLAAQTGVIPSIKDPFNDAEMNIFGLINVLDASVKQGVKCVVQASSAAPLGEQEMPLDETKVPRPSAPYGASKLACEGYCSAFSCFAGLRSVVLRFSNVYGPKSMQKGSVVAKFIKQILAKEDIIVYGDGTQTRDFIHVKDICQAIHLGLTRQGLDNFELFQIATGKETSVNELWDILKSELKARGVDVPEPVYEPERPGEIKLNYSDISKARSKLGFDPKIELADGVKETVEWFLNKMQINKM